MREIKKEMLEEPQPLETEGYQIYHIKEEDVEEDHGEDGEAKDIQEKHQPEGQQVFVVKQEYIENDHGLDDEAVDLAEGEVEEPHSSGTEGYRIFFVKEEDFEDDQTEMQISSYEQDVNPQPQKSKLDLESNQLSSRGDKEEDGSSGYEPETEGKNMRNAYSSFVSVLESWTVPSQTERSYPKNVSDQESEFQQHLDIDEYLVGAYGFHCKYGERNIQQQPQEESEILNELFQHSKCDQICNSDFDDQKRIHAEEIPKNPIIDASSTVFKEVKTIRNGKDEPFHKTCGLDVMKNCKVEKPHGCPDCNELESLMSLTK